MMTSYFIGNWTFVKSISQKMFCLLEDLDKEIPGKSPGSSHKYEVWQEEETLY